MFSVCYDWFLLKYFFASFIESNKFQYLRILFLIRFSRGLNFDPIIKGISFLFLVVGCKKFDLSTLSTVDMLFSISDSR